MSKRRCHDGWTKIALSCLVACLSVCSLEAAPPKTSEAADRLWLSFTEKYQEFSLKPLSAEVLDQTARAQLISLSGRKFSAWKSEDQPTLPAMVAAMVAKDPATDSYKLTELLLTNLLPKIDVYGHYKSAADISQLNEALRQNTGSVQMTLEIAADGRVLCYPQPDGVAEKAGVNPAAELLEVDGRPVLGKTLSGIRLVFVGQPKTKVVLKIKQPQGKSEVVTLIRSDQSSPIVTTEKGPLGISVHIRRFDKGVSQLIKTQLENFPNTKSLTLDLRGNPGGLRDEALKTASLFFAEGAPLGQFISRSGTQNASDGNGIALQPVSIQIRQDARTASAAEYLIAVLKETLPEKVTLYGYKTYGKSHSTIQLTLEGGGELAVTEALMATASGKSWDKVGITPDHEGKP